MSKISVLLVTLSLILAICGKGPILVTLYQKPEEPEQSDYVEIVLKIGEKGTSLPQLLNIVEGKAAAIEQQALAFCGEPQKKRCQESVEFGEAEIESKYQLVKKVQAFQGFEVQREVVIKVYKQNSIGQLVDQLQSIGVKKFESFTWKNTKEIEAESTVIEGAIDRAKELCSVIGYGVDRIVSIQKHIPEQEEEKEGEEQQKKQEQQESEEDLYKVEIECVEKKKGKGNSDEL